MWQTALIYTPLIHGLCRRPILDSHSKLSVNFSGRSPNVCAMLHYRLDAQLFLRPHRVPQTDVRQTCYNGNRGVTHSLTQEYCTRKYGDEFCVLHLLISCWGTQWRWWVSHGATNGEAAGSIPDGVIWNFQWHNPSDRTMALGVDAASNRNEYQVYFLGVKAAGA
jgi:hypothetical protein